MAEANKDATANPPATSGGLTKDEVNALLADAIKPLATTLQSLGENQKVIADTLAKLPPAAAAAATDAGTGGAAAAAGSTDAGAAKPLTAEDVTKLITTHSQQQQQNAEQRAAREAFVKSDRSGLARIAPVASAMGFDVGAKLGADQTKWGDEAKAIASGWETYLKDNKIPLGDLGGGARDGGAAGGAGGAGDAGAAKPGAWIKLPA
jgi:hypothetical protein